VIGELKQSEIRGEYIKELLRFSGHAREVFAAQPTRRFLHGFIIRGSSMELWVFDRSGPYGSEKFDIHKDPRRFIKIMFSYTRMSDEESGVNTHIKEDKTGKYIVLGGADPDSKDSEYGRTPLWWAAAGGYDAVVKLLLAEDGVDPDAKDTEYGRTPLSWAAANGYNEMVKQLLTADGVDPNSRDANYGRTPLWWAAEEGHDAVVKLLLANDDVDLDSKDTEYGQTPLSVAAGNGHQAVVKLLLANEGVKRDSKDVNEIGVLKI